ncbi:MAG: HD domain-containing protein [Firmicutes bacterium]|nr:HD domain-containing protein [Bacillota bacterium]
MSCLSDAIDLISPLLNNHHKQVTYISYKIAEALSFSGDKLADLVTAALLHDAGALNFSERIELLNFEENNPYRHAIGGYVLLEDFEVFKKAGEFIKHHHLPWRNGAGRACQGDLVHLESHILHLADRIAVSINKNAEVLNQVGDITRNIKIQANSKFHPHLVEVFRALSEREAFWLDLVSPAIGERLKTAWKGFDKYLKLEEVLEVTNVFARIIDFRSRFTSVHSSGVAAVARAIASKMNCSKEDCIKITIAGNLHDLGKLALPNEILEKPGRLTREEYNIMKTHTYHSYHILKEIQGLEDINEYASFHHERLDGSGYPFRIQGGDLREGSRIIAIADVLTAIIEDRPYREGMKHTEAMQIIETMGQRTKLDAEIVSLVKENLDEINAARQKAQQQAASEYKVFERTIHSIEKCYCQ